MTVSLSVDDLAREHSVSVNNKENNNNKDNNNKSKMSSECDSLPATSFRGGGSGGGGDSRCTTMVSNWVRGQCTMRKLQQRVPIITWLPHYSFKDAQCDVIAGFTVGLTVIPQALAYATIAKLPPQYGLYSAFMGCFIYAIFGTSKDITLGPTAIMSLLTGSYMLHKDPTYAVLLTFLSGCIQIIMGIFNLGFLINFLSHPVLSGFVSAAAIIIAFGQVKNILGIKVEEEGFIDQIHFTFSRIKGTNYWDLILGIICLLILLLMKKIKDVISSRSREENQSLLKKVFLKIIWLLGTGRNAVVVVITAATAYSLSQSDKNPFTLTQKVEQGLPTFALPKLTTTYHNQTVSTSEIISSLGSGIAVIPLIAILESVVIGKAFAKQNRYKLEPTQEMIAIGLSNLAGSFVSSYPITGSFSRTAVNSQSGVRTPLGGLTTGALVLLALGVLAPSFSYIPKTSLAAVIITAVLPMLDFNIVMHLWKIKKMDLIPLFITFLSCLFLSIEYGIIIGIGISICFLLYPLARPGVTIAERDIVVVKPLNGLYFPAVEYIKDKITTRAFEAEAPKSVILDCSHISGIDSTTVEAIEHLVTEARDLNTHIVFCSLRPHLLSTILKADIDGFQSTLTLEEGISLLAGELSKALITSPSSVANADTEMVVSARTRCREDGEMEVDVLQVSKQPANGDLNNVTVI